MLRESERTVQVRGGRILFLETRTRNGNGLTTLHLGCDPTICSTSYGQSDAAVVIQKSGHETTENNEHEAEWWW